MPRYRTDRSTQLVPGFSVPAVDTANAGLEGLKGLPMQQHMASREPDNVPALQGAMDYGTNPFTPPSIGPARPNTIPELGGAGDVLGNIAGGVQQGRQANIAQGMQGIPNLNMANQRNFLGQDDDGVDIRKPIINWDAAWQPAMGGGGPWNPAAGMMIGNAFGGGGVFPFFNQKTGMSGYAPYRFPSFAQDMVNQTNYAIQDQWAKNQEQMRYIRHFEAQKQIAAEQNRGRNALLTAIANNLPGIFGGGANLAGLFGGGGGGGGGGAERFANILGGGGLASVESEKAPKSPWARGPIGGAQLATRNALQSPAAEPEGVPENPLARIAPEIDAAPPSRQEIMPAGRRMRRRIPRFAGQIGGVRPGAAAGDLDQLTRDIGGNLAAQGSQQFEREMIPQAGGFGLQTERAGNQRDLALMELILGEHGRDLDRKRRMRSTVLGLAGLA